ncbi:hypothetical protein Q7P37_007122 [Cladosporium fusiforme]
MIRSQEVPHVHTYTPRQTPKPMPPIRTTETPHDRILQQQQQQQQRWDPTLPKTPVLAELRDYMYLRTCMEFAEKRKKEASKQGNQMVREKHMQAANMRPPTFNESSMYREALPACLSGHNPRALLFPLSPKPKTKPYGLQAQGMCTHTRGHEKTWRRRNPPTCIPIGKAPTCFAVHAAFWALTERAVQDDRASERTWKETVTCGMCTCVHSIYPKPLKRCEGVEDELSGRHQLHRIYHGGHSIRSHHPLARFA